jgi:hypothetical protein
MKYRHKTRIIEQKRASKTSINKQIRRKIKNMMLAIIRILIIELLKGNLKSNSSRTGNNKAMYRIFKFLISDILTEGKRL